MLPESNIDVTIIETSKDEMNDSKYDILLDKINNLESRTNEILHCDSNTQPTIENLNNVAQKLTFLELCILVSIMAAPILYSSHDPTIIVYIAFIIIYKIYYICADGNYYL